MSLCKKITFIFIVFIFQFNNFAYADIFSNKYMAHAGGGYDGNIYNNTEEAFENSLSLGFNFIEVDMLLTADHELVCFHGWDEKTYENTGINFKGAPTYEEFMSWRVQGKYHPLDVDKVIDYMIKNPYIYVEIDLKKDSGGRTECMINQLIDACNSNEQILSRILMQFTSENAFYHINSVYEFKNYQYFTYKSTITKELDNVIEFCSINKIKSIAVNHNVLSGKMISKIKQSGMKLLVFTIDDQDTANYFLENGADTICTNFIIPD